MSSPETTAEVKERGGEAFRGRAVRSLAGSAADVKLASASLINANTEAPCKMEGGVTSLHCLHIGGC